MRCQKLRQNPPFPCRYAPAKFHSELLCTRILGGLTHASKWRCSWVSKDFTRRYGETRCPKIRSQELFSELDVSLPPAASRTRNQRVSHRPKRKDPSKCQFCIVSIAASDMRISENCTMAVFILASHVFAIFSCIANFL